MDRQKGLLKQKDISTDITVAFIDGIVKDYLSSNPHLVGYPGNTGREYSYDLKFRHGYFGNSEKRRNDIILKVLSSIRTDTKLAASYGKDSIKVVLIDRVTGRLLIKFPSIYRTSKDNVRIKLERYLDKAVSMIKKLPLCPECGSPMVFYTRYHRTKKNLKESRFYGCSRYPFCKSIVREEELRRNRHV